MTVTVAYLYVVFLFVFAGFSVVLATYGWRHRSIPGGAGFSGLMLGLALGSLSLGMSALSASPRAAVFWWFPVRYVAGSVTAALFLVFVLDHTRREMWLSLPRMALLFAFPLIEAVSRFTGQPREFYPELAAVNFDRFIFVDHIAHRARWGAPWDMAHLIYLYLVIGFSLALLLIRFFRTKAPFRTQAFLLAMGPLFMIVTDLLDIGDGTQLPWISATVFGFLALELLYAWALFRYRLFDIVPIARDLVIESMNDAVLVLDDKFRLVDVNPAAQALTGRARRELIGQPLGQILPALPPPSVPGLRKHAEIVLGVGEGERHIAVNEQPVLERGGRVAGHLVFLQDIGERKKAEAALQRVLNELEQRVAERTLALTQQKQINDDIISNLPGVFCIYDDQYRLIRWNRQFEEITGYAADELLNRPVLDVLAEQDRVRLAAGGPADDEGSTQFEAGILTKAGTVVPLLVTRVGTVLGGQRVKLGFGADLTQRKQMEAELEAHRDHLEELVGRRTGELEQSKHAAEAANVALISAQQRLEAQNAALQASERKYRLLVENLEEGVWAIDAGGHTTFVNRRMAEMLGYRAEEMLGRHIFEFMGEQAREKARQLLERRRQGITDHHEFEYLHRDGTPVYTALHASPTTDDQGNYVGALAGVTDISQRREMEEALRRSEAMFRTLAEQSPNMILIYQGGGGRIVYANPRFAAVTGYTLDDLSAPDLDYSILVAAEDLEPVREVFRRHRLGEEASTLNCRLVTRGGKTLTAVLSTRSIDYAGERSILATITDISPLVRADERRETLYRMSEDISTSIDVREICVTLHNAAAKLMPLDVVEIALRRDGAHGVVIVYHHDPRMTWSGERLPDGPCLASHVISTGQSLRVSDLAEACVRLGLKPDCVDSGQVPARTALAVALLSRGRVVGMIAIGSHSRHEYSATEQEYLEILAAFGAAAFENARLHAQAQAQAVAEERSRLARDLHDSVTQTLYSVALTAEALPRVWEQHPAEARAALNVLHRQARGALGEMRILLLELRPAILLEKDLSSLLRELADATMGRNETVVEINVREERRLPDDVRIALYRIIQEALNNVARHARAESSVVELDFEPQRVSLYVQDDGIGFDVGAISGKGCGLQNMAERAREIGAEFALHSELGRGTRIELVWRDHSAG